MFNEDQENIRTTKPSIKSVFLRKDFFKLWLGQLVSNTGSRMSNIILPLFIFFYTKSPFWLGVATFAQLLPVLFFSSYAGMFVDSHNRKSIMIASDLLNAVFIILIPITILFDKDFNKNLIMVLITLFIFIATTVKRFFYPARYASIPRLVTDEELGIAISISQTSLALINVFGPILGVILVVLSNYSLAFVLDSASFLFSAIMLSLIVTDLKPLSNSKKEHTEKPSLLLGIKKVWEIKTIRFLSFTIAFTTLGGAGLSVFMVIFIKETLHMSDIGFGIAMSILGTASVLSGVVLSKIVTKIHRPVLIVTIGYLLTGLSCLPFFIITQAWQLYLIEIAVGILNMVGFVSRNLVILRDTTDNIRGQVNSTEQLLFSSFHVIGLVYSMIFITILGIRLLFLINGAIFASVGFLGLLYLFFFNNLDGPSAQRTNKNTTVPTEAVA